MILLIDRLDQVFRTTDIWLMTSHGWLVLLDSSDSFGRARVTIYSMSFIEFRIGYSVPDSGNPFSSLADSYDIETTLATTVSEIDQAIEHIRTAMRATGGWPQSVEVHGP